MRLVIVRRGQLGLFRQLEQVCAEEPDVFMCWDRRMDDRRSVAADSAKERRVRERRGAPPYTWGTKNFIVITTTPAALFDEAPGLPA